MVRGLSERFPVVLDTNLTPNKLCAVSRAAPKQNPAATGSAASPQLGKNPEDGRGVEVFGMSL